MGHPVEYLEDDIQILSTPYAPDRLETNAMRSRIVSRVSELAAIDEDLRCAQTPIHKILARRCVLTKATRVAEGLLAPIRKLPEELLGTIFTHTIPSLSIERALKPSHYPFDEGDPYPHHMRFILRRVCRLWNIVTRQTPRVWSTLVVEGTHQFSDLTKGIVYSKACPLDIYIGTLGWRVFIVTEKLRPEVGRIRQLIMPTLDDEVSKLYLVDIFPDAHSVEVLAWSWGDHGSPSPLEIGVGPIDAPKLQYMALMDSPLALRSFSAASLRSLRRFYLRIIRTESLSSGKFLGLLEHCPSLEELEIHNISGVWDSVRLDGIKIPLAYLKVLVIADSQDNDTVLILEGLHAPSLEELSLSLHTFPYEDEGRWPIDRGLRALLADAPTSLRKLKLEHLCLCGDDDMPLLSPLVNLGTLEIKRCIVGNAILVELTPEFVSSESETWPCPRLSRIVLDEVKLSGYELGRLVRFRTCAHNVHARPARSTVITIKHFHGLQDDHNEELSLQFQSLKMVEPEVSPSSDWSFEW